MPSAPRHQGGVAVGVHGALTGVSARHGGGGRNARSKAARTITITTPMTTFARKTRRPNSSCVSSCRRLGCDRGRIPPYRWPGRRPAHGGVPGRAGRRRARSGPGDRRTPEVVRAAAVDVDQDVVGRRDLGEPARRARIGPVGVGVEPPSEHPVRVMDLSRRRGRAHAQHGVGIERQPACAGAHPASVGPLSGCRCPPSDRRGSDALAARRS
jgi:hypothetical protein